jgi:histidinol-phosphate aminotransferase
MSGLVSRRSVWRRGLVLAGGAALAAGSGVTPAVAAPVPQSAASVLPPNLFGPKPGFAKLSQNENPYGPAPSVLAAVSEATTSGGAYYADTSYLLAMIAERNGLRPEQVALSSGSIEGLTAAAMGWGAKGEIVVPSLFWETPYVFGEKKGVKVKRIALTAEWDIDLPAMEAAVGEGVSLVHICNPNNPTGKMLDPAKLRAFCLRVSKKATVLVDEAYVELTSDPDGNSMMDLVRAGENVIIARTFSKIYGMAGMRIGYMMSTPANIARVRDYTASWMGAPQIAAAVAAYDDHAFLDYSRKKVIEGREIALKAIKDCGLSALPAETNFLYVKVPDAALLQQQMHERKITIRGVYGPHTQMSRVSMGRIEDVECYGAALKEIFGA